MRALIVEDDRVSGRILQNLLSQYGECHVAVDGEKGLQAFRLSWEEGRPYDLICLDIMMPGMDGHQVLREIRAFEAEKNIGRQNAVKVLIMSAQSNAKSVKDAFYSGQCVAFLVKPIDRKRLIREIRALGFLEKESEA